MILQHQAGAGGTNYGGNSGLGGLKSNESVQTSKQSINSFNSQSLYKKSVNSVSQQSATFNNIQNRLAAAGRTAD